MGTAQMTVLGLTENKIIRSAICAHSAFSACRLRRQSTYMQPAALPLYAGCIHAALLCQTYLNEIDIYWRKA